MKTLVKHILIVSILVLNFSIVTFSQPTYYENGDRSKVGASPTHGAPLNDGFIILLLLVSVYGVIKYYNYKKAKKDSILSSNS